MDTFAIGYTHNHCLTLNQTVSTALLRFRFSSLSLGSTRPFGQDVFIRTRPPSTSLLWVPSYLLLFPLFSLVFPKFFGIPLLSDSLVHSATQQLPKGPHFAIQQWNQVAVALPQRAVLSFNSPWFTCIYLCLSESPQSLWAVLFFYSISAPGWEPTHRDCLSDA